ncbi:MAG: CheW domain-containing protein [Gemmatimonadetes bacterium]|nr:CheW domain-containing protein [Gemmatimonadota bacterium]
MTTQDRVVQLVTFRLEGAGACEAGAVPPAGPMFGLYIRQVEEVLPVSSLPASRSVAGASGAIQVRGSTLPMLDATRELAGRASGSGPGAGVLIVRLESGSVALLVEALSGVRRIRLSEVEDAAADAELLLGVTAAPGREPILLLDVEALVSISARRSLGALRVESDE